MGALTVYILGAATVLSVQAALIGVVVVKRAIRRESEQQAPGRQSASTTNQAPVRHLASRLLNAQERERSRIAGELHDDVSQQLAALKIHLGRLGRMVQGEAGAAAAEAARRTEEIAARVHDLSHGLHPARLRLMGLVEGLHGLRRELSTSDATITVAHEQVPATLPPDLTLCLFRIVQEALHNALEHGRARHVSVDLRGVSESLALTVGDDGVGFDVGAVWDRGLGLISMRERVEAIGGTFEVRSRPGAGTRLEVRVPVSMSSDTDAVGV